LASKGYDNEEGRKMKCTVVNKDKNNIWAVGDATFYIINKDEFDHPDSITTFAKVKNGDILEDPDYWYSMRIKDVKRILKSIKPKKRKNYSKASIFLENPKKVKYYAKDFGGVEDGTIVNAYLIASKGGQHILYMAKDSFVIEKDGARIDDGSGSVSICTKRGKYYRGKYGNDRIFRGWRNVGEETISDFVNDFLNGILNTDNFDEEGKRPTWCTESSLLKLFNRLNVIELKEAKRQLSEWKKKNGK
jgi:hypothetical protein